MSVETENKLEEQKSFFSRREWFGKVSIPAVTAVATIAAGGAGFSALASGTPHAGKQVQKVAGSGIFNIRDFGAKGDGKTLDTLAVQKAIDACHKERGGTVLVPAGDFVIGTVEIKSYVTIHLSAKGKLLGSPKKEDYSAGKGVPPGNGNIVLLYAANAENITIEGKGTIDGNGTAFIQDRAIIRAPTPPEEDTLIARTC